MMLITGGAGMAMQALRFFLEESSKPYQAFLHKELDISDLEGVKKLLEFYQADWLVNGAAYTKVDSAENESAIAIRVNDRGPCILARACSERAAMLLHLSTDYVFDGSHTSPYREDDPPVPLSEYGRTKRAGEIGVLQASSRNLVVRTSGLYGAGGRNFVHSILSQARLGKPLRIVDDQVLSPTWTGSLAGALLNLIEIDASGIVHFSNIGGCSWFEFAEAIIEEALDRNWLEEKPEMLRIGAAELKQPACRPAYSVLDCSLYAKLTCCPVESWKMALRSYFNSCTETPT